MTIHRNIVISALFFILLSGLSTMLNAQTMDSQSGDTPHSGMENSLDDYIRIGLLNNPGLKASFEKWQAALEKVEPAKTLPDPRFTYANYIEEVETRVGAQKNNFGLSQTFPWFGKLDLKGEIANQEANAAKEQYETEKIKLIARIKKIYHEYSYLAQAIKITKDNIALVSNFEGVANAKYKSGVGLQNAVIKTQVELGKLEDRLSSLKDSIRPIGAKLNIAMNRPSNIPLPLPEKISENKLRLTDQELMSLMREKNPGLKALDYIVVKEDNSIRLAEKNYYPDFTIGINYIDTKSRYDANPIDNGKDPIIANLSINIPIWRKKYDSQVSGAKARYRSALDKRREQENTIVADLEIALYKLRDADRKIKLYSDTLLPKAEQNVKIDQLAFTSDKTSFLDLIDSQRVLLEFQLSQKRALTDYAMALAEIEMLTGTDFERNNK
jgi:cobalt-zinc-cadmium efflux system outer membrane protein